MIWRATPLADSSDGLYVEVAKSHAKRNCLVIGPAGSGKLSLVRGLATLANSRARKFLFDWEVEPEAQEKLLIDLQQRCEIERPYAQVWIFRQMHRIPKNQLGPLLDTLRARMNSRECLPLLYGTCIEGEWFNLTSDLLRDVFGIQIRLGHGGYAHGSLDSVLQNAMQRLKKKYGGENFLVEPEAAEMLERLASDSSLGEALDVLERAYLRAGCRTVTASALTNQ